jgi:hypothetical protein
MEIPDLSYQLNIDCEVSLEEFVKWFREEWTDLKITWRNPTARSGFTVDNWIELQKYHGADPVPFYILVASRHNTSPSKSDFQRQIEFTRLLIARLKEKGCEVEFHGYFAEHL